MCNCTALKCEACDKWIQIHIADYAYSEGRFGAWCHDHVKQAAEGSVVFTFKRRHFPDDPKAGTRCAIFGPEVGEAGGNHPNVGNDWTERVVKARKRR